MGLFVRKVTLTLKIGSDVIDLPGFICSLRKQSCLFGLNERISANFVVNSITICPEKNFDEPRVLCKPRSKPQYVVATGRWRSS